MRKVKVGITGIFLLISGLLMAQNVNRTPQGVKVNVAEGNFNAEVIFYSPSIVRIVKYPSVKDQMPDKESLSVTLVPEQTNGTLHRYKKQRITGRKGNPFFLSE